MSGDGAGERGEVTNVCELDLSDDERAANLGCDLAFFAHPLRRFTSGRDDRRLFDRHRDHEIATVDTEVRRHPERHLEIADDVLDEFLGEAGVFEASAAQERDLLGGRIEFPTGLSGNSAQRVAQILRRQVELPGLAILRQCRGRHGRAGRARQQYRNRTNSLPRHNAP